jgi:hypothetical protein
MYISSKFKCQLSFNWHLKLSKVCATQSRRFYKTHLIQLSTLSYLVVYRLGKNVTIIQCIYLTRSTRITSWSWSYGSWIFNYPCNQCLSSLELWVRIPFRWGVLDTTLCYNKYVKQNICLWPMLWQPVQTVL